MWSVKDPRQGLNVLARHPWEISHRERLDLENYLLAPQDIPAEFCRGLFDSRSHNCIIIKMTFSRDILSRTNIYSQRHSLSINSLYIFVPRGILAQSPTKGYSIRFDYCNSSRTIRFAIWHSYGYISRYQRIRRLSGRKGTFSSFPGTFLPRVRIYSIINASWPRARPVHVCKI